MSKMEATHEPSTEEGIWASLHYERITAGCNMYNYSDGMRVETGRSVRRLSQQSGEKWWLRLSGGSEHVIVGSCEFYIYLKVETTRKREVQDDSKI